MEMSGEQTIAAPRQKVWEALNDPEVLKQSIPGCQSIEKSDENEFTAKVKAKVGPVNATFSGKVTLSDLNPPASYRISGEGTGGAAGFAKGGAKVELEDQGESTKLSYDVDAQVGGKLAQLGQRLIKSTANKYATQFFEKFRSVVEEGQGAAAAEAEAAGERAEAAAGKAEAPPASEAEAPSAAASPATGGDGKAEAKEQAPPAGQAAEPAAASAQAGQAKPSHAPTGDGKAEAREQGTKTAPQPAAGGGGLSPAVWIGGVIAIVVILLVIFAA